MTLKTLEAAIIDRGRGPEIAGTRITVYDVMDYLKDGWPRDRIAALFRLSSRDVQAAIEYIERRREQVEADYARILERHRTYQYPATVRAKIDRCREAAERRLDQVRHRRRDEAPDAKNPG
jgi:uncharacterized protein (DUF433 family)